MWTGLTDPLASSPTRVVWCSLGLQADLPQSQHLSGARKGSTSTFTAPHVHLLAQPGVHPLFAPWRRGICRGPIKRTSVSNTHTHEPTTAAATTNWTTPVTTANAATSCFHLLGTQNNWREAAKNPLSWQPGTVTIPAGSPSSPAALRTPRHWQHDASPDTTAHPTLPHRGLSSSWYASPRTSSCKKDPRGGDKGGREATHTICTRTDWRCGENAKLEPMQVTRKAHRWDPGITPYPGPSQFSYKFVSRSSCHQALLQNAVPVQGWRCELSVPIILSTSINTSDDFRRAALPHIILLP